MIEDRGCEAAGQVTNTAIGGCRNMAAMLSNCRNTIVTGRAVTDYAGMIEERTGKTGCVVADAAILAGGDMRRRLRKRTEYIVGPIVARHTITGDARMSEYRWLEGRCSVAGIAILVRWHM